MALETHETDGTLKAGAVATGQTVLPNVQPSDMGYLLWTNDPTYGSASSAAPTTLRPYLVKVKVAETVTVATMTATSAGTSLTGLVAGSNRMGIYDLNGVQLGQTGDITTWAGATPQNKPLTAPVTITGGIDVFVWFALLVSASGSQNFWTASGTLSANILNNLQSASEPRVGWLAAVASGSSLPASFTPASDFVATDSTVKPYWIAAS